MSTLKRFTLLLVFLILTACSVPFAPTATPQPPTPTTNPELVTLAQNRQKWDALNITHYRFKLVAGCFCSFRNRMPLAIEVKDAKILSIVDNDGKPTTEFDDIFNKYNTIERLFSTLDSALNGDADKTTVTYNTEYGYPASIYIDYIQLAADDEMSFTVSDFETLK